MKVEFGYNGFSFKVEGEYYPGRPEYIGGPPESCYPAEPAEFDVTDIYVFDDNAKEYEKLIPVLYEYFISQGDFMDSILEAAAEWEER